MRRFWEVPLLKDVHNEAWEQNPVPHVSFADLGQNPKIDPVMPRNSNSIV
jgi:hypothetical protein